MRSRPRVVLAERRMTQRELQRRMGVSKDVVWRMTRDESIGGMPLRRLDRAAEILGCEVSDLYER